MTHIAYIIGCSGSGKSYTAKLFKHRTHLIHSDLFISQACMRLCPFVKPGKVLNRKLWETLLEYTNAVDAICWSIQQLYPKHQFKDGRPIVAEGIMLSNQKLRDTFACALENLGVTISASEVFLLDIQPDNLLKNIQHRNRSKEQDVELQTIKKRHQYYSSYISEDSLKSVDSVEQIAQAIESFLFEDSQIVKTTKTVA